MPAEAGPEPRPADIVVFGAPGATSANGKIALSAMGRQRAGLAARFWLSFDQERQPMRIICVAGRPEYRGNMPALLPGESESSEMIDVITELGVPVDVIRPNYQFPLQREYSISTIDEVGILIDENLISAKWYKPESPLAIVAHKRHGARIIDILQKIGFTRPELCLISPPDPDSFLEIALRLFYRLLVLRSPKKVPIEVLKCREDRLMAMRNRRQAKKTRAR